MRHTTPPTPNEFGLSADDLSELKRIELTAENNEGGVSWMENFFPKKEGWLVELIGGLLFWTVLWPFFLIGLLFTPASVGRVPAPTHSPKSAPLSGSMLLLQFAGSHPCLINRWKLEYGQWLTGAT